MSVAAGEEKTDETHKTSLAPTIAQAAEKSYRTLENISFDGMRYRSDSRFPVRGHRQDVR